MKAALRAAWGGGTAAWRERVAMALPVLLMGGLALFTWWLVRHTPRPDAASAARAPRHEIDYEMSRFVSWRFVADGSLRTTVDGAQMRHFGDDGSVEIDAMRLWALDDDGRVFRAAARLAQGDAELHHVRLLGQAHVVREAQDAAAAPVPVSASSGALSAAPSRPGGKDVRLREGWLDMQGEELLIDTQDQRVRSQRPVTVLSEAGRVLAGTLDHDGRAGVTQMGGRVKGVYWAPRMAASAPQPATVPAPGFASAPEAASEQQDPQPPSGGGR